MGYNFYEHSSVLDSNLHFCLQENKLHYVALTDTFNTYIVMLIPTSQIYINTGKCVIVLDLHYTQTLVPFFFISIFFPNKMDKKNHCIPHWWDFMRPCNTVRDKTFQFSINISNFFFTFHKNITGILTKCKVKIYLIK